MPYMIETRQLGPTLARSTKSVLPLGPRQTGKSTLMATLALELTINLAHEATLSRVRSAAPRELDERLAALPRGRRTRHTVLIDEVQRLPSLLNTVQALLDRPGNRLRFLLTGSERPEAPSCGNANLLPGPHSHLPPGPLVTGECDYALDNPPGARHRTLPGILTDADPASRREDPPFLRRHVPERRSAGREPHPQSRRFRTLPPSWPPNGRGKLTPGISPNWLRRPRSLDNRGDLRYFEILEDTLIVLRTEPFAGEPAPSARPASGSSFFDVVAQERAAGQLRRLSGPDRCALRAPRVLAARCRECRAADQDVRIASHRTEHGAEVDFVVERGREVWALELKASSNVGTSDLRALRAFADFYGKAHTPMVLYLGDVRKRSRASTSCPGRRGSGRCVFKGISKGALRSRECRAPRPSSPPAPPPGASARGEAFRLTP